MSIPIATCRFHRAAKDEVQYQDLVRDLRHNIEFGSYTQFPCGCDPKCTSTEQQQTALQARLSDDLKDVETKPMKGPRGPRGRGIASAYGEKWISLTLLFFVWCFLSCFFSYCGLVFTQRLDHCNESLKGDKHAKASNS